jgi:hypothetical protein
MSRRDLAFVHLHRPVKAAYLKAIVRAALEHDPEERIPVFSTSDISRIYIFVPASAGVIIQTLTSRRGYETTEFLKTVAMKRSIELPGTEVAPIVRASESMR